MNARLVTLITALTLFFGCSKTNYQLGQCDKLYLDFKKGTLNGVSPTASMDEIKKAFPCFTGQTEEGSKFNCGGGVFFLNHQFFIYTHRDYIDIRKDFKGTLSNNALGLKKEGLIKLFGQPDDILKHDAAPYGGITHVHQYSKNWGTLAFFEKEGIISEIELHHGKKIGAIEYCF